ncbi:MAG: glycosyltransferase family 4 protein [Bacteroidota bacterium]
MKVAVIGLKGLPANGGAATVGQSIINELKADYDFTVLSVSSYTHLKSGPYEDYQQVVFRGFGRGGLNTFLYYLRCAFFCIRHKFDLIHLHHAESGFIVLLLKLRSKVVVTFHGVFLREDPKFSKFQNGFFRFSERLNVKFANKVVSVSEPDSNFIFDKYKRKIRYIPNSIRICNDIADARPEQNPYIFFAAGRIYEIKGLHLLLKAAAKMQLPTQIIVAGSLDQVQSYKDEIISLSKGMNVIFLDLITDKEKLLNLLAHAEFFVFPSLTEAMSIMLLEAVSTKVPVIASDIPSNKTIFNDSELLFFRSNDINDLEEKLRHAVANKTDMAMRAGNAYSRLIKEYTGEIVGAQYREIYESLLK